MLTGMHGRDVDSASMVASTRRWRSSARPNASHGLADRSPVAASRDHSEPGRDKDFSWPSIGNAVSADQEVSMTAYTHERAGS